MVFIKFEIYYFKNNFNVQDVFNLIKCMSKVSSFTKKTQPSGCSKIHLVNCVFDKMVNIY